MFRLFTIYGVAMLASLALAPMLAVWKNRNGNTWGFISFFFPPALLVLAALPRGTAPAAAKPAKPGWDEQDRHEDKQRHGPD